MKTIYLGPQLNFGQSWALLRFWVLIAGLFMPPSCRAAEADAVFAWGANDSGQCTVPADATRGVVAIAAGGAHTLALRKDGSVLAWGENASGQSDVPSLAQSAVIAIAAGSGHSLALRRDGSVVAWGGNSDPQGKYAGQTNVPGAARSGVTAIAAGGFHSVALKSDGSVVTWGFGPAAVPVDAQSGVMAIAAGGYHTVALRKDGSVVQSGILIEGVPVAARSQVKAIAAGGFHTLALKEDGSVVAWGENDYDQTSVPPAALSGVKAIAAGWFDSVALKTDGSVIAWGKIGLGGWVDPFVPMEAQSGVQAISAGSDHFVALIAPTAPMIITSPASQSVELKRSTSFAVVAGGYPLRYQWEKNGSDIKGATDANFTIHSAQFSDAGNYTVRVSNDLANVTSAPPAVVTVTYPSYNFGTLPQRAARPTGIAVDAAGNIYVVESIKNRIRKIARDGSSIILAGPSEIMEATPTEGYADGMGSAARFNFTGEQAYPGGGIAVDQTGNLFVADTFNSVIRKITPEGSVTTLAGDSSAGTAWWQRMGFVDGSGSEARFALPMGLTVDKDGNIYVADDAIRKVTPSGVVTTITSIVDGQAQPVIFNRVVGIAVDQNGNIMVANRAAVWKVTPEGTVTPVAGSVSGYGFADGTGTQAQFSVGYGSYDPSGALAVDRDGNLYVADTWTGAIRKVTAAGVVTTLGGSGVFIPVFLNDSEGGGCTLGTPSRCVTVPPGDYADGAGTAALFHGPSGIAVDSDGNILVADRFNDAIRIGSAAPALQVSRSGGQLIVSWPADPAGFTLQWTSNLSDHAQWADSGIAPSIVEGRFTVNATIDTARIYRLKK